MKDFFTWDESIRDLLIVISVGVLMYVSAQVTPINLDTVISGSFFNEIFAILQGKASNIIATDTLVLGVKNILTVIALIFFAGIIWISFRSAEVHHKEHKQFAPVKVEEKAAKGRAIQWQVVIDHVNSENPAEWKLGILEADNMLDSILEEAGYQGDSIGEKLKSMNPLELRSYNDAWEAHKIRNQIAHEGAASMEFSKKIARDTALKFENVFKEMGQI